MNGKEHDGLSVILHRGREWFHSRRMDFFEVKNMLYFIGFVVIIMTTVLVVTTYLALALFFKDQGRRLRKRF